MELVGYEFDDQDRSGRFVITKQPEEIEKDFKVLGQLLRTSK